MKSIFKVLFLIVLCAISTQADTTPHPLRLSEAAQTAIQQDWLRQERIIHQNKRVGESSIRQALEQGKQLAAYRLSQAAQEETSSIHQFQEILGNLEQELDSLVSKKGFLRKQKSPTRAELKSLYFRVRWAVCDFSFTHPKLDFDELLFVKRHWPQWNHQCSHRMGEAQIPGANLCVLKGLSPDGEIRDILEGEYAAGGIGRPDLSYDAKRLVFPYAKSREVPTPYGYGLPQVRGGACLMYDLYEVNIDGTGLRQLTHDLDTEDTEPCYLPDGRIAFTSSRGGRLVQCGDWALACGIYSMNPDGSDVRQITEPKEGEFYPAMLEDGRILYTRWDYLMKGYNVIQQLWSVMPDGRAAQLVYGDHYAFSKGPIAFMEARQVPGTSYAFAVGAAHHNTCVGPIMRVDMAQNRGGASSMSNLTPWVGYPEINPGVENEICQESLPGDGMSNTHNKTGWYASPWPLDSNCWLACYSFEEDNIQDAYGLYLMDAFGNQELIYRFDGFSCYAPRPLKVRERESLLPNMEAEADTPALCFISDVYEGLDGVPRGTVKYLRVLETHSKLVHTEPQRMDVGVNSGWDPRGVLGTVPVDADGSAFFEVPANKQLFFEVLDKDYLEIRRMRNFVNFKPGETRGCVGCHEGHTQAPPANHFPTAAQRAASPIAPPPWGTDAMDFERVVQPVLDKRCVSCHDGSEGKEKSFDLTAKKKVVAPAGYDHDQGSQHIVSQSFLNLLAHVRYVRMGGYQGTKLPSAIQAIGSAASPLMAVLAKGHYAVSLTQPEWRALAAWIDCNAPYTGGWDNILHENNYFDPEEAIARRTRSLERLSSASGLGKPVLYYDCGARGNTENENDIQFVQKRGAQYIFNHQEAKDDIDPALLDILYDNEWVEFELTGLTPNRNSAYSLGIVWWDHNNARRVQRVTIIPNGGQERLELLPPRRLPNYTQDKQPAEVLTCPIPAAVIQVGGGQLRIEKVSGVNCVVSEIALWDAQE